MFLHNDTQTNHEHYVRWDKYIYILAACAKLRVQLDATLKALRQATAERDSARSEAIRLYDELERVGQGYVEDGERQ